MPRTLKDFLAEGRDPFAAFRVDEALAIDAGWLARVVGGAPLTFWDGDESQSTTKKRPYTVADGVAEYVIEGPLMQRGWMCFPGYDSVARDLDQCLADASVRSVLLRVNSPGGVCAGCFDGARAMRERVVASGKRVTAFADEMAYSAAYALACIADEIVIPEAGGVGSVGVIASLVSEARALDAVGLDVRLLTSGREKADGHPALPFSAEALTRMQGRVDELGAIFHRWVGERRGMTPDAVRGLEAGVRHGRAAVESGLADRVLSLRALRSELRAASLAQTSRPGASRTGATRTPALTPRNPMPENLLAALAALTGTTDPEAQAVALAGMKGRQDAHAATVDKLSTELGEANTRAKAAEARADKVEREQELAVAKTEGKWTPALDGFLSGLGIDQLRAWRASAPTVVPQGEIRPPSESPTADAQLSPDLAAAAAKGWKKMTAAEKHALSEASPAMAERLRRAV